MIPGDRVFCDTGFFFACLAPGDDNYRRAGELLEECRDRRIRLLTTWEILGETVTLLAYRLTATSALEFLSSTKPALEIVPTTQAILQEAERVFRRQVRSRRLSFCDAVSFVIVATILDHIPCLSFDEDFRALGLTVIG